MTCSCPDGEFHPRYGVAPHECYWRKPGGFVANPLGTSTIEPFENWPDNFLAEIDPEIPVKEQISWGLCGVYFCSTCKANMPEKSETLWSKERILKAIAEEDAE